MALKKIVERQTGVALWRQIADRIRLSISNGDYDATGMVPPETVLAQEFGVNRHTVRSALAALAEEGLVRAVQGRGTMIERKDRVSYPISRRTRFSQGLGRQVKEIATRLLGHAEVPASGEIAAALAVSPGAVLIELRTVSSGDGRPLSTSVSYYPAERFPRMAEEYSRLGSVTKAFAAHGLDDYVRVSTELVARHADAQELSLLKLSPGAIVMEAQSVNADLDGKPVEFSRTRFAADRMKLRIET
ncbi:GntR family phosphonate transport system transcriptional regulator [Sinorhizobium terangae]|uniref:Phosphonate metabolism transcriptional regulator PhnF n=1 Tax=Sinorhizobium terangae TaxID=110322 RepID=A0A6N7LI24_SINTE|nr:phosphonate metabolism transcriptional regulator PhnF [Sinorhizobium terangae]MBB4184531.1 GntR family phosphonate transport system transcriptional regulator [Sinorhizobium terangae]MQX16404.1 phosphonate metabolism transcriptional regulator PhnF [Sinorhizobium terangae]